MASGVGVDSDCMKVFTEIKLKHKHRYVLFWIKDAQEIQVCKTAPREATYEDFQNDLLAAQDQKESRYAVFDADYTLSSGQQRSKLVFIVWNPDSGPIKQKMLYSSSKDALKKALQLTAKDFQANDASDIAYSNLMETLLKNEVAD